MLVPQDRDLAALDLLQREHLRLRLTNQVPRTRQARITALPVHVPRRNSPAGHHVFSCSRVTGRPPDTGAHRRQSFHGLTYGPHRRSSTASPVLGLA